MSDTAFVLGISAIAALAFGITAYVRYKDTRDDRRQRPLRCFRWGCDNPAVEGTAFCADCIADMERKGIKV